MSRIMRNLNRYSKVITQPKERGAAQAMLYALGLKPDDLDKPQVGICSMWYQGNPCNAKLNLLSEKIESSVNQQNLLGLQFNTIGISDGISMGTSGMKYSLPSRDLISDSIETVMRGMHYDSLVCIPGCDKNLPGSVMAMVQLNRPSILVYGGSMPPSKPDNLDIVSAFESYGQYLSGDIDEEKRQQIVQTSCHKNCGSCSGFYTANTMACLFEVMGLTLPNSSSNMSLSEEKIKETEMIGPTIKKLIEMDLKPLDILTKESFNNAIKFLSIVGGSTNAVIHLLAIAKLAKIELSLSDFEKYQYTPVLTNMKPHGKYVMDDLSKMGGTSTLIKYLINENIIDGSGITVTGKTLQQNVEDTEIPKNFDKIVYPIDNPYKIKSHISILNGNLAPNGCLSKVSSYKTYFRSSVKVFNSEKEMLAALKADKIGRYNFVVIRYQGETVGCPEMLAPTSALIGYFGKNPPPIATDGRFSGGSHGILIAHLPDAFKEYSITKYLEDGDVVELDLLNNKINLKISNKELQKRQNNYKIPEEVKDFEKPGYLGKFQKLVGNIESGFSTY